MSAVNRLTVHLGDEDVSNRTEHVFRRPLQQVRKSHEKPAITEANGVVNVGKAVELYFQMGHGRARPQFAVGLIKYLLKARTHDLEPSMILFENNFHTQRAS